MLQRLTKKNVFGSVPVPVACVKAGVVLAREGRSEHEQVDDCHQRPDPRLVYQVLQRARGQLLEPGVSQCCVTCLYVT